MKRRLVWAILPLVAFAGFVAYDYFVRLSREADEPRPSGSIYNRGFSEVGVNGIVIYVAPEPVEMPQGIELALAESLGPLLGVQEGDVLSGVYVFKDNSLKRGEMRVELKPWPPPERGAK